MGIILTLLILLCFVAIRIYTKRRTKTNETLDNSKQSSSLLCTQDAAKVNKYTTNTLKHKTMDDKTKK